MTTIPLSSFDHIAIDRIEVPQHFLDLKERVRTNLFPWRGQFSPGLVGLLLSTYASTDSQILDPFAGVGTTLFEAARMNLPCVGTEVNPAAIAMAETIIFTGMKSKERRSILEKAQSLLDDEFPDNRGPLFGEVNGLADICFRLSELVKSHNHSEPIRNVLTNVLIRICEIDSPSSKDIHRAFRQHSEIVESLPHSHQRYSIANADARKVPVADDSIDLVVTSPPYINVFNYHQNNRRAMELLGWDLLHVAKSEFGSNRKHRGNRLLTVIQYCLDMEETLLELYRVMKRECRAIIVVGRESSIRGLSFQNGSLVGALAEGIGFTVSLRQERKFTNRFGATIYEDLIHLTTDRHKPKRGSTARKIALEALTAQICSCSKEDVIQDLKDAIDQVEKVRSSPLYASIFGSI